MTRVGITGNIGSGKSTVTKVFAALGIPVYYADIQAAIIINTNIEIKTALKKLLGNAIYDEHEMLNKKLFAELIFTSDEHRRNVNAIVHPAVSKDFEEWFSFQDAPYVIKEAALLFESRSNEQLEKIICVQAPFEMRIARVMKRDGRSEEQIRAIESKQMSEAEKVKRSDYIITNNEANPVIPQVLSIHQKIVTRGKDFSKDSL